MMLIPLIDQSSGNDETTEPSEWYMDIFQKHIRIKDDRSREEIIHQIRHLVSKASKGSSKRKDIIDKLGDPAELGKELSKPINWEIDLGTPISPRSEIEPFFSRRGQFILSLIFLMAFAIPIGILIVQPEIGWILPGVLMIFIAIWALGLSFLNNYMGYLSTLSKLKNVDVHVSSISQVDGRRYSSIFLITSIATSLIFGSGSLLLDISLLSVSIPITISTITAATIAFRMMIIEGRKVLS